MLDVNYIRDNLKEVSEMLRKREVIVDLAHIIEIDDERKKLIKEVESLRHERREVAEKNRKKKQRSQVLKLNLTKNF
jgi:seryl-tRNA synthetase